MGLMLKSTRTVFGATHGRGTCAKTTRSSGRRSGSSSSFRTSHHDGAASPRWQKVEAMCRQGSAPMLAEAGEAPANRFGMDVGNPARRLFGWASLHSTDMGSRLQLAARTRSVADPFPQTPRGRAWQTGPHRADPDGGARRVLPTASGKAFCSGAIQEGRLN